VETPRLHLPLIVIKLGGAALTDKKRIYTAKMSAIDSAAKQVAAIYRRNSLFIVHGAGSYGHLPVIRFGLSKGFQSARQLNSLAKAKRRLLEWEFLLDRALLQYAVPVLPFLPSDYVLARKGRIVSCNTKPITAWMKLGCVPSTGGDIVPDLSMGFSILSGDQLAVHIARALRASMLIFATDVDGIYDSDPKQNQKAQLIRKLRLTKIGKVSAGLGADQGDVTRGMKGKLEEAKKAVLDGIPVFFVNLHKGKRLQEVALGHRSVICSEMVSG